MKNSEFNDRRALLDWLRGYMASHPEKNGHEIARLIGFHFSMITRIKNEDLVIKPETARKIEAFKDSVENPPVKASQAVPFTVADSKRIANIEGLLNVVLMEQRKTNDMLGAILQVMRDRHLVPDKPQDTPEKEVVN